jgi:hypothetical protein
MGTGISGEERTLKICRGTFEFEAEEQAAIWWDGHGLSPLASHLLCLPSLIRKERASLRLIFHLQISW